MQCMIRFGSISVGVPKLQLGLNLVSSGLLVLAPTKNSRTPTVFRLLDAMSVSGTSSTFLFSGLETDWFTINSVKSPWICRTQELVGQTIDMEFSNTMFGAGLCDIKLTLIDSNGDPEVIVEKMNIKTWGGTLAGGRVRAKLQHQSGPVLAECKR